MIKKFAWFNIRASLTIFVFIFLKCKTIKFTFLVYIILWFLMLADLYNDKWDTEQFHHLPEFPQVTDILRAHVWIQLLKQNWWICMKKVKALAIPLGYSVAKTWGVTKENKLIKRVSHQMECLVKTLVIRNLKSFKPEVSELEETHTSPLYKKLNPWGVWVHFQSGETAGKEREREQEPTPLA